MASSRVGSSRLSWSFANGGLWVVRGLNAWLDLGLCVNHLADDGFRANSGHRIEHDNQRDSRLNIVKNSPEASNAMFECE